MFEHIVEILLFLIGTGLAVFLSVLTFQEGKWRNDEFQSRQFHGQLQGMEGRNYILDSTEMTFGKGKDADLVIMSKEGHPWMDFVQGKIFFEDGSWFIENLSSEYPITLKTTLGKNVVLKKMGQKAHLLPDEKIIFGTYILMYKS